MPFALSCIANRKMSTLEYYFKELPGNNAPIEAADAAHRMRRDKLNG
jgi:hypothetical protein